MPNLAVDVNSWARSACYPQGSFYGPSIRHRRITNPDFRPCSSCCSHSQARFCICTLQLISNQSERTFGRLRYALGGDRPSQTARLTLSLTPLQAYRLELRSSKSGIPTSTPHTLACMPLSLPPILYMLNQNPISGCSKAPWGLPRQRPNRYAFRAGQNLPDKEFRYLRTVIVTAAVHWGFGSELLFR